jgi:hypothetical protein
MNLPAIVNLRNFYIRRLLRFAFDRIRIGKLKIMGRLVQKLCDAAHGKQRQALMMFMKNANTDRYRATDLMWRWKVATLTKSYINKHTYTTASHRGSNVIVYILAGAFNRNARFAFDRMKVSKKDVLGNLWKWMNRNADVELRKAWSIWA